MSKQVEVLVLDDFQVVVNLLDYTLSHGYGMKVYKADTMELALDILKINTGIKVVLLDIRIYDEVLYESTFSLCRKIRERMPCTVLIAMTGYASIDSLREARICGFDDYITKPFRIKEVAQVIEANLVRIKRWEKCVGEPVKNINTYEADKKNDHYP